MAWLVWIALPKTERSLSKPYNLTYDMKKFLPLLAAFLWLYSLQLKAQVTISADQLSTCEGATVTVDVTADNWVDIVSAQFGVSWDTSIVTFVSVANNMPPTALYNTDSVGIGQLRFSWFDFSPPIGETFPNGTVLFTITFNVVGNYGEVSPINLGDLPGFMLEISNTGGVIPNGDIVVNPGSVSVEDNTPPTISGCPSDTTVHVPNGVATASVSWVAPTASDNCPNVALTSTHNPGDVFPVGMTTVTYTATDGAGNATTCSFVVTVVEDPPPPGSFAFIINDQEVECPTASILVPVSVQDFNNIGSFQFGIIWDETILNYQGVMDNLPPAALYNSSNSANGELKVSWFDLSAMPGLTLTPPDTVIFTLQFSILHNDWNSTTISFAALPGFPIEVANPAPGGVIPNNTIIFEEGTITLNDTVPPVLSNCPDTIIVNNDAGLCSAVVTWTEPTATDNCSTVTISRTHNPGDTFPVGTTQVMYIATDFAGNADTCVFQVVVQDNESPVLNNCPGNIAQDNDAGDCGAIVTWTEPTVSDNCPGATMSSNASPGDFFPVGTTTVTYTATDAAGNSSSCSFDITVSDVEDPVIACPGNIVMDNDPAQCGAVVTWAIPSPTDNCGIDSTISSSQPGDFFPVNTTTVTYTTTDLSGNVSICSFDITVNDVEPPKAVCTDFTAILDSNGQVVVTPADVDLNSFDNCGVDSLHVAPSSFDCDSLGDHTVVLTVVDAVGNSSTCTATVSVLDNTAPVASCKNITLSLDANGEAFITGADIDNGSTDNCGIDTMEVKPKSFNCQDIGNNAVVLTVFDASGNEASCTANVKVEDQTSPKANCKNITITLDAQGNAVITPSQLDNGSTDNCTIDSMAVNPNGFNCSNLGANTSTFAVFDQSGNSATCTSTVTVQDLTAPTITCPADTVVAVPLGVTDTIVNNIDWVNVNDNCGSVDSIWYQLTGATTGNGDNDASGNSFNLDTTTVTYYARDNSGNVASCSFKVIVINVGLSITCPSNVVVANDPDSCGAQVFNIDPIITPMDSLQELFYTMIGATAGSGSGTASGNMFNMDTTTVTYTAVSTSNELFTCQFTVVVQDTQLPFFLNCPANLSIANTPLMCGFKFDPTGVPDAFDNCSYTITSIPSQGTILPVGITPVSVQIQDPAGHTATCTYNIEVLDSEPPAISACPTDLVQNNDFDACSAVVTWTEPTATDNCALIAFTPSQGPNTVFNVGVTPVEYVAVDASGNVSKCVFNVTVNDSQAPVLSGCLGTTTINTDAGECFATATWTEPTATDNCGVVSLSATLSQPAALAVGTHTATYIATDPAGNADTCSFDIVVVDNEAPSISGVPADVTLEATPGQCGATYSWAPVQAFDNCGIDTFMVSIASGSFFDVGVTEVKFVAADINGNVSIATFNVTVEDQTPPAFNCPANILVDAEGHVLSDPAGFLLGVTPSACDTVTLDFGAITATDDCGVASLIQTSGQTTGSAFAAGTQVMTYLAIDNNGNANTCSFTITVEPLGAVAADVFPAIACEGEEVTFFANTYDTATYTWRDALGFVLGTGSELTLPSVNISQGGTYTVEVSFPWGCTLTGSTLLTVAPNPAVVAGANDLLCQGGIADLLLTADDTAFAGVVDWVWEYPNGAFVFEQNPTVPLATSDDSGTYTVTGITDVGCAASATVEVQISDHPPMPLLSGTESATCVGTPVVLNGQIFSGGSVSYHWAAVPATGSGLMPINNPIVQVKPTLPGDYTYYYYVVVDGCTSDTAEWQLHIEAPPTVSLSVDGNLQCVSGTDSIQLLANGQAASWFWEGLNTGFISNEQNPVIQNASADNSDTYKLTATTANGCVSTASINVNITDQPPAPTLSASATELCAGAELSLAASPQYANGAQFIWTGNNLPTFASNVQTLNLVPNTTGNLEYTFAAVVNACTTSVATVNVLVEAIPPVSITIDGNTECVDGTTPVTLISNAVGATQWAWTNQAGTLLGTNETLVFNNATSANSGIYNVVVSNSLGCSASGSITLTITDALPAIEAKLTQPACEGGTLNLSTTLISGASYEWKGPGGTIALVPEPVIQNASAAMNGNYTVTASKNGCSTTSPPLALTVITAPNANNDLVMVEYQTPKTFSVVDNDGLAVGNYSINVLQQPMHGSLSYQGNGQFQYNPAAKFRENDQFIYEVCYTDCPDLCDFALVTLEVRHPADTCVMVNVITPNEDGINDQFVISCLEFGNHPDNHLIIFNQWGDKVFEASPYENDWKGTYQGKDLPDGTYFYIFRLDAKSEVQKGFVMVHR